MIVIGTKAISPIVTVTIFSSALTDLISATASPFTLVGEVGEIVLLDPVAVTRKRCPTTGIFRISFRVTYIFAVAFPSATTDLNGTSSTVESERDNDTSRSLICRLTIALKACISAREILWLPSTTRAPLASVIRILNKSLVLATGPPVVLRKLTIYSPSIRFPNVVVRVRFLLVFVTATVSPFAAGVPSGCFTSPVTAKMKVSFWAIVANGKSAIMRQVKDSIFILNNT